MSGLLRTVSRAQNKYGKLKNKNNFMYAAFSEIMKNKRPWMFVAGSIMPKMF